MLLEMKDHLYVIRCYSSSSWSLNRETLGFLTLIAPLDHLKKKNQTISSQEWLVPFINLIKIKKKKKEPSFSVIKLKLKSSHSSSWKGENKEAFRYHPLKLKPLAEERWSSITLPVLLLHTTRPHWQQSELFSSPSTRMLKKCLSCKRATLSCSQHPSLQQFSSKTTIKSNFTHTHFGPLTILID